MVYFLEFSKVPEGVQHFTGWGRGPTFLGGGGGGGGIFFGCLRGRCKALVPMANANIFSQFAQKNPNHKVVFM